MLMNAGTIVHTMEIQSVSWEKKAAISLGNEMREYSTGV